MAHRQGGARECEHDRVAVSRDVERERSRHRRQADRDRDEIESDRYYTSGVIPIASTLGPQCGNGLVEYGEQCDGGACCTASCTFVAAATTCRAASGVCDVAESCTGSSSACPADGYAANGTSCGGSAVCQSGGCCGNGVTDGGDRCDDGNRVGGDGCSATCQKEGCGDGDRVGLKDRQVFPNTAICGAATSYDSAKANAASVCSAGWHMCTPYAGNELDNYLAGKPQPASESWAAWLSLDESTCTNERFYSTNNCTGTWGTGLQGSFHFNGTGGCGTSGSCGEGYRPDLTTWYWGWSLGNGTSCAVNASYACAYPGGARAQDFASTACCRN